MQLLSLKEAVRQIVVSRQDAGPRSPYFLMLGAGISHPPIPLASGIMEHCRGRIGDLEPPPRLSTSELYGWHLNTAYPSPSSVRAYFRTLVEANAVTHANLRLAHLILSRKLTTLALTVNFDDFLERALATFGEHAIVCDHPETVARIDPEDGEAIQVVHIHGSHYFYDMCNLTDEIEKQAASPMGPFLSRLLAGRSPLVIGYSGWEKDAFMCAMRDRLMRRLGYYVYWFCYNRDAIASLPEFLRKNAEVRFVVPPETEREVESAPPTAQEVPTLSATEVFDALIHAYQLPPPELVADPIGFSIRRLQRTRPPSDRYYLDGVIEQLTRAKALLDAEMAATRNESVSTVLLAGVRDAILRADYAAAVAIAGNIDLSKLKTSELLEVQRTLHENRQQLFANPQSLVGLCDIVIETARILELRREAPADSALRVAAALVGKGIALNEQNKFDEGVSCFEEAIARFAEAPDAALRAQAAKAYYNMGNALRSRQRFDDALRCFDEAIARLTGQSDPELEVVLAFAMVQRSFALSEAHRVNEAIQSFDAVIRRFSETQTKEIRSQVAWAYVNKGALLSDGGHPAEAIADFEEVIRRFGGAAEVGFREQVAKAIYNKGVSHYRLNQPRAAYDCFDDVIEQFSADSSPNIQKVVERARLNKKGPPSAPPA